MTSHWYVRSKTDSKIFGPYTDNKIKEYLTQKQLGETHQLSSDRITWIECNNWRENATFQQIGKYQIIRELGRGGMGVVYLARDTQLQRDCALKVLFSQGDVRALKRFSNEARSIAQLTHPYIIKIFEVHTSPQCFFAMEYIPGIPFQEYMASKKNTLQEKLQIFSLVCEAIAYAHSKNILHRDLKPDNIIITKNSKPIILDFGLAKNTSTENDLTKTNEIMGTPRYMCPEMVFGDKVDHRGDVYSLGVILYEILTERTPFMANSMVNLVHFITSTEITPPSSFNPEVKKDSNVEIICLKALKKNKLKRITSVSFFKKEIDNVLANRPIKLQPPSKMEKFKIWCRKNLAISASIFLFSFASIFATVILYKAKLEAEEKNKIAEKDVTASRKEVVASKKNLINNMLHILNIQKYSLDVFSKYLKIKKCYDELFSILKLLTNTEIDNLQKMREKIDNHLKFLILPNFPHVKTIKMQETIYAPLLSESGKFIAQLHENNKLYIWETEKNSAFSFNKKNSFIVIDNVTTGKYFFSKNDKYIMYLNLNKNACVYNLVTNKKIISHKNGEMFLAKFTPDSKYAILTSRTKKIHFYVYDLQKKIITDSIAFLNIDYIKISPDSKWIMFYANEFNKYFIIYNLKTKNKKHISHKIEIACSIFFNKKGDEIYLLNIFNLAIYDIKKNNITYYDSSYDNLKSKPIHLDDESFIFNERQAGLVLAKKLKTGFIYKEFKKYTEEKISKLLFAPSNFLGLLKNHNFEIRDRITKNMITFIKHFDPIKSAKLIKTDEGLNIFLASNSVYKKYQIFFKKIAVDAFFKKVMQDKIAQKWLFHTKIAIDNDKITYVSKHGFAVWQNNEFSWNFYKFTEGNVAIFKINTKTNKLYALHRWKKILVYDLTTSKVKKVYEHNLDIPNKSGIARFTFSFDHKYFYVADKQGIWEQNLETNSIRKIFGQTSRVMIMTSTKSKYLILGLLNGGFYILNPSHKKMKYKRPNELRHAHISTLVTCESKEIIATGDKNGMISLWQDYDAPKWKRTLQISSLRNISFSPFGKYMAIFTENHVYVYSVEDLLSEKKEITRFEMYAGYYKSGKAAFSKDWKKAYFPNGEGDILVFKQPFILDKLALKKEILRCDNEMKENDVRFTPLLQCIEEIEKHTKGYGEK